MCYCAKIKEMMKISKEEEIGVAEKLDEGVLFVKYYNDFDDYTLQYCWVIDEGKNEVQEEVKGILNEYLSPGSNDDQQLSIVQIGVVCIYGTDSDQLCKVIELERANKLDCDRDTKYVFFGSKVLRVIQYYGRFSNPFECLDSILKWNELSEVSKLESHKSFNLTKGIECCYIKETNSIIFLFGNDFKNAISMENYESSIPPFLYIDSLSGIIEHNVS